MRIRTIALKNLNSLYGEFRIDLDADLRGAPLFLVRGPTGAGKSTLTDAVALALFGQTPRLDRQEDADPRQIVSRGTGTGYAQVEFTKRALDGTIERYKATWQCHRAREKPDGAFQDPRRILARLQPDGTWLDLVSDRVIQRYQPVFDEVLEGMTVEDFRRMMVLAQGEFAAFLQAGESERARILERLTSTSGFRAIGQRAFERRQQAERDFNDARAAVENIQVLGGAEEAALRSDRQAASERLQQAAADLARVRGWADWIRDDSAAVAARDKARVAEAAALEARAACKADIDALAEHERCHPAAESLRDLDQARAEHRLEQDRLPELQQAETEGKSRLVSRQISRYLQSAS